ncbi:hypothetical protein [Pelotalea chapellei]|uniref:Uncharacterized protein n=1 Tax=Pelotalea chapellei TaxID=44671 RepID=A0ABS5U3V2_9BACT|nr:hypothetical protein [Pelotalea chapellei]MBT1070352.1 hypothetical protein [Pelotalea chapellei]
MYLKLSSRLPLVLSLFLLLILTPSQDRSAAAAEKTHAPSIAGLPKVLPKVTKNAVGIYQLAKEGQWEKTLLAVEEIKNVIPQFSVEGYEPSKIYAPQLGKVAGDLAEAASAKDRHTTMMLANRITLFSSGMAAPLRLVIPTPVELLMFYGRELEIWSDANDTTKLADTVAGIDKTWSDLQPMLEARGGTKEASMVRPILLGLKASKSAQDYAQFSKPLLHAAEKIEMIFRQNSGNGSR